MKKLLFLKKAFGMKALTLFMALVLTFALSACGGGDTKKDSEASSSAPKKEESSGKKDKLAEIKERGVLYLGTSPDFPPCEFYYLDEKNQKQIDGYDIRLGKAIAEDLGVKLEIKATDFNGVLANIQAGQVDMGISGFTATEKRKESMQFSKGYNTTTEEGYQGIMMKKETASKFKTLEDLKKAGLKIGAQGGSIQFELALKLTGPDKVVQRDTMDSLALALDAGDIDAVTVSSDATKPILQTFKDFVVLPKDNFNLDPDNMYATNVIGFPLGDQYQSLIEESNKVIDQLQKEGKIEKWIEECKVISEKTAQAQ